MADSAPPDRLNIASFKQRKVCVEIDRIGPPAPQTNSDRFFDGARAAFRRVKRSMSQRPASSKATVAAPPPPQIRKAAVARRHTWEMELVKWRQHALV